MYPTTRLHRAFTLIELLVVVSLIVLLVAMLLPALGRARHAAWRVMCQSNLRQVGNATVAYLADNDRKYPDKNGTMYSWLGRSGSVYLTSLGADERALNAYLGNFGPDDDVPVAQCQTDTGAEWGPGGVSSYDAQGASYGANTHGTHRSMVIGNGDTTGIHVTSVDSMDRMVVMADNPAFASAWWSAGKWATDAKMPGFFWHEGEFSWNLLFADAHVNYTFVPNPLLVGDDYTFVRDQ